MSLCTTCGTAQGRYKCPACLCLTCSLACNKTHKSAARCSGKRDRTSFIPRSKFDDASINDDYNFLTTLERDLDNAARLSRQDGATTSNDSSPRYHHQHYSATAGSGRDQSRARSFVKRAKDVGEVTVLLAPRGMKRSRSNKSSWVPKRRGLTWTVEWVFHLDSASGGGGGDGDKDDKEVVRRTSDRVPDETTLLEAVGPSYRKLHPNHATSPGDTTPAPPVFLIRNEAVGGVQQGPGGVGATFAVLDGRLTLGEALRHRTVIEFPTLHVHARLPTDGTLEPRSTVPVAPVAVVNVEDPVQVQGKERGTMDPGEEGNHAAGDGNGGGDYIPFNLEEEEDEEEEEAGDERADDGQAEDDHDDARASSFNLPPVNLDDLEVPYN